MPRDSGGTYTLPPSNPVVDGTIIETLWANPTMQDIAVQLNNVITRDGLLGATAPIGFVDGTAGSPGIMFAAQPNTGFYRAGANTIGVSVAGNGVVIFSPTGIGFQQPISIPLGTAALPGLSFVGDPNMGLFSPGANLWAVSTGGTERMRIDPAGNVGIGTTNTTAKLNLGGAAELLRMQSDNAFLSFYDGANAIRSSYIQGAAVASGMTISVDLAAPMMFRTNAAERMRIDAAGNVGINNTAPLTPLDVKTFFSSFDTRNGGIRVTDYGGGAGDYGLLTHIGAFHISHSARYDNAGFWMPGTTSSESIQLSGGHIIFSSNSALTPGVPFQPTEVARINNFGNLLVGTANNTCAGAVVRTHVMAPDFCLGLTTLNAGTTQPIRFSYNGANVGAITTTSTATAYLTSSDHRLKSLLGPIIDSGDIVDALNPVEFSWLSDGSVARGFLAHEFQEQFPNSVSGEEDEVDEELNPVFQLMDPSTPEVMAVIFAELKSLRARLLAGGL